MSKPKGSKYEYKLTDDGVQIIGGDPYKITIYCADSSHDESRRRICIFNAFPAGSPYASTVKWQIDEDEWVDGPERNGMDFRPLKGAAQAEQYVKDGQRYAAGQYARDVPPDAGPTYVRYKFRCLACGVSVECRDEKLYPILDTLEATGMSEIELASLAARLRRPARPESPSSQPRPTT